MLLSQFREKDGIHEALASFPQVFPDDAVVPIFRVRAVRIKTNRFMAVLRTVFDRGPLLLERRSPDGKGYRLERAKKIAVELLLIYLKDQSLETETTITRKDGITRTFDSKKATLDDM